MTIQWSDLLMSVPIDRAHIALIDIRSDGALALGGNRRIRAHLVLSGEALLHHGGEQTRIVAGDFVIVARDEDHAICARSVLGGGGRSPQSIAAIDEGPLEDGVRLHRSGDADSHECMVLTATMRVEHSSPRSAGSGLPSLTFLHGAGLELPRLEPEAPVEPLADLCRGTGGRALAATMLNLLYIHALRSFYQRENRSLDVQQHLRRRHLGVEASLRLLQRRYGEPWTVATLASAVGMSRSAFASAFHAALGHAPGTYLAELRLEVATRLLGEGALAIAEIAHAVGFRSQAAFSRAFRRRYAMSAREYRARALREA